MSATQRLSALDAAFLGLETRDIRFVYASILAFDRPIDLDALRAHVDGVLAAFPRYRQRIVRGRLGRASWRDDPAFRIDRQIQAASVAVPGGPRELEALAARLLEIGLPPGQAPWGLWTVGGLAGGRGAVISLVHHALVDGIGGFQMLDHILTAEPAAPPRRAAVDRPAPLRQLARWSHLVALARLLRDGLRPASNLGINPRRTSPGHAVASHTVDLAAVRTIGHVFDATNNDVMLATVAGALRRFATRRGLDPARLHDVRAMVPVARHVPGDQAASGNQVVLLLAPLPIHEPDPIECLLRISAATRRLKTGGSVAGGDLLVALSDATTPAVLTNVLRLALRVRAFNLIVTNVPGPRVARSLLGANLTRIVPIVNLWPHQALGIAVASYAGAMTFGIHVDRGELLELDRLRDDLAAAFDELLDAASHAQAA